MLTYLKQVHLKNQIFEKDFCTKRGLHRELKVLEALQEERLKFEDDIL